MASGLFISDGRKGIMPEVSSTSSRVLHGSSARFIS